MSALAFDPEWMHPEVETDLRDRAKQERWLELGFVGWYWQGAPELQRQAREAVVRVAVCDVLLVTAS